jgi:hypothetical protein
LIFVEQRVHTIKFTINNSPSEIYPNIKASKILLTTSTAVATAVIVLITETYKKNYVKLLSI